MPQWVSAGVDEYARRLRSWRLELIEVATAGAGPEAECAGLLRRVPADWHTTALDRRGQTLDTAALAARLQALIHQGQDLAILIGGADGLARPCLARCDESWSLSALTFAHPLVRVILAEQLYRAWTILNRHPYHRD